MAKWRKIQYPMIERTKKQKVPEPGGEAVDPVGDVDGVRRAHHDEDGEDHPHDRAHVDTDGLGAGEGQGGGRVGPLHGQNGEGQRAHQLRRRLPSLVEPEAPPVVDLDVVVEEPDEAEGHHCPDGQVPGAGEADLGPDVADGIPGHDRSHDGDTPHGGRACLGDVAWPGPSSRMCWPISRVRK